jgi:hypothetical protein
MIKAESIPVNLTCHNLAPPYPDLLELFSVHPKVQEAIRVSIAITLGLKEFGYTEHIKADHLLYVVHLVCDSFSEEDAWLFQYMPNIRRLYIQGSDISSTWHFEHLNQLENLDLGETKVYDLFPLMQLPTLRSINVQCTRVLDLDYLEHIAEAYLAQGSWGWERRVLGSTKVEREFAWLVKDILSVYAGYDNSIDLADFLNINYCLVEMALEGKLHRVPKDIIDGLLGYLELVLMDGFGITLEDWKSDLDGMPDTAFFAEKYLPHLKYVESFTHDD